MNKLVLVGHVAQEPMVKEANGTPLMEFRIGCRTATKEKETLWYKCTGWGGRHQKLAQHLKKGQQLIVSGELTKADCYTAKQSGEARVGLEVRVDNISFGKPPKEEGALQSVEDDDLPF